MLRRTSLQKRSKFSIKRCRHVQPHDKLLKFFNAKLLCSLPSDQKYLLSPHLLWSCGLCEPVLLSSRCFSDWENALQPFRPPCWNDFDKIWGASMMPCGARLDHEWGKAFWEKNNPAQYFSDFALLSSRPGAWNLEEGVQRTAGSLSCLRTRRRFLFFGRRKKSRGRARGEKERRLLSPLRSLRASSPIGRGKQVSRNRAFSRGSLRLPNSTATLRVPLVRPVKKIRINK